MGSTHDQFTKDHRHNNVDMSSMLLKVNRDSHLIKKSSSSPAVTKTPPLPHHMKHPHHPVIIYTHSPKVIHTKPEEFRALIQTLTGYTGTENTTKNNPKSPVPQPAAPPPLAAAKQLPIMFYDFEEFETKNVIPLNNNNNNNNNSNLVGLFNKIDDSTSSIMKQVISMNDSGGGECASLPVYFPPPVFDPHQTALPFFAPNFEEFCYNNNNNNNKLNNNISDHSRTFYNNSYSEDFSRENESDFYYNIGTPSSLDMCLLQSSSSPSEAIDELPDFS